MFNLSIHASYFPHTALLEISTLADEGDLNMSPQNMPLWLKAYCEHKGIKN